MADFADLPVGFSLMLAQRPAAMRRFAALSPEGARGRRGQGAFRPLARGDAGAGRQAEPHGRSVKGGRSGRSPLRPRRMLYFPRRVCYTFLIRQGEENAP